MTREEAIARSIEKWRAIAAGRRMDRGTSDCALCRLYLARGCVGCPVMERTGVAGCEAAPYELDWRPLMKGAGRRWADTPGKRQAAGKVLDFLLELQSGKADCARER